MSFLMKSSSTYGLTTNSKIVIKKIPIIPNIKDMTYCKLNIDMNLFEVMSYDFKKQEITLRELTTDNEVVISFSAYEYLFEQLSTTEYLFK